MISEGLTGYLEMNNIFFNKNLGILLSDFGSFNLRVGLRNTLLLKHIEKETL